MSIKDHKPVALFKSVTYPIQKEKEKYFIVETVKHTNTPQKPFHSITINSHQQNHNSNQSTSTNFTVKSDNNKSSKKDQGSNSKTQNIPRTDGIHCTGQGYVQLYNIIKDAFANTTTNTTNYNENKPTDASIISYF